MKTTTNEVKIKKRHLAVMWLCFLYGGFTLILFILDIYTLIWRGSTFFPAGELPRNINANSTGGPRPDIGMPFGSPFNAVRILTSPLSIANLFSGIMMLAAGFTILKITREKEIKKIRQDAAEVFLLPDEKKIIAALKENNYALTQSQLTKTTGLGKVQVHRVIKRLEMKELIDKHEYGLTNKIVLKKEYFE